MKNFVNFIPYLTPIALLALFACALSGCKNDQQNSGEFAEVSAFACPDKTKRVEDKSSSYPEFYCVGFDGKEGPYLEFDARGRIKTKANYHNDKLVGTWTAFHPDGSIDTVGEMDDNKRVGTWKQFYVNGNLRSEKVYRDSVQNGPVKLYYQSGQLMAQGQFENGLEEKRWQVFTPQGKLARECDMVHGKEENCTIHIKEFQIESRVYNSSERGAL